MKTTVLYLHDSTAWWTLWRGQCLTQVFREPITREMAEPAAGTSNTEGSRTSCPWLSVRPHKVRLLIDPLIDQTRTIPAFDYGLPKANGNFKNIKKTVERIYLTSRTLASEVIADDLTRYRRDQLNSFPKAFLQWNSPNAVPKINAGLSQTPPSWLIIESGVPDYVLDWLKLLSERSVEIMDVRPVSTLFSIEDAKHSCSVVTVWAEPRRCRLLVTTNGILEKSEQWTSEAQALIALEELISTMKDRECCFKIEYIGEIADLSAWQKIIPDNEFLPRENSVRIHSGASASTINSLPSAFCDLPVNSLLRPVSGGPLRHQSQTAHLDLGVSIRLLLLNTLWKRRHRRSMLVAVTAAVFSGYFVFQASMHALTVVELRDQANSELQALSDRRASLNDHANSLHSDPLSAAESIALLNKHEQNGSIKNQAFFSELASLLIDWPGIRLDSVSWRSMQIPKMDKQRQQIRASVEALVEIKELIDTPVSDVEETESEGLILISGRVLLEQNQQQASDTLINFLNAISAAQHVIDVVPVTHSLSLTQALNLPSDAILIDDDPSAFVVAVRLSV